MKNLIADFVQFYSAIADLFVSVDKLGIRLGLHSVLRFSKKFPHFVRS